MSDVNLVIIDDKEVINLTQDTVTEDTLLEGYTAHNSEGDIIEGKMTHRLDSLFDVEIDDPKKGQILEFDEESEHWKNTDNNKTELSIVDGALNQTYDTSGSQNPNAETTNPIVLDATAKMMNDNLKEIVDAIKNKPQYILPSANVDVLGGIKPRNNLTVDVQGFLDAPTKVSAFENDKHYLTDGDIFQWAKEPTKPKYTYEEVGALPDTTTHLSGDIAIEEKGVSNGVATLGDDGKVPASQLPSYVDDVEEYDTFADFPYRGESGKIYIDKSTNKTYRWSGTMYVFIASDLALGETSSTAYAGDKGKQTTDDFNAHKANTDIHITSAERDTWNAKQNALTDPQIDAVNSGITDEKVIKYDNYSSNIESRYIKPNAGIPKGDLETNVQESLEKADTALQSFTETDPTVPEYVKSITETDIASWNNKVDSISGKGLSSNDYTDDEKNKLQGIEANANKYELPVASADILGGVKIGENLYMRNGVLNATGGGGASLDLEIVGGALNQTYDPDGDPDEETTNPIVLDSTAQVLNEKLQSICEALNGTIKNAVLTYGLTMAMYKNITYEITFNDYSGDNQFADDSPKTILNASEMVMCNITARNSKMCARLDNPSNPTKVIVNCFDDIPSGYQEFDIAVIYKK